VIILTFHFGVGVNAQNTPLVTALTAMLHRYLTVNTHVSTDHKITARLLESTCIVCQSFQFSPKVRDAGILRKRTTNARVYFRSSCLDTTPTCMATSLRRWLLAMGWQ